MTAMRRRWSLFFPKWVGYAWAFPRPDHISFGIATTQDAFDHEALDKLLWDFMVSYYEVARYRTGNLRPSHMKLCSDEALENQRDSDSNLRSAIRTELKKSAERYAARIPGLEPRTWDTRHACGEQWALLGDAAGFADPVTGEGIYYALRSAELFAESYLAGSPLEYENFGAKTLAASCSALHRCGESFTETSGARLSPNA